MQNVKNKSWKDEPLVSVLRRHRAGLVVLSSLVLSFIVVFLFSFSVSGAQRTDDYAISLFTSAIFPESYPCLFIAKSLGLLINALSASFAYINWFYMIERLIAWLSISFIISLSVLYCRNRFVGAGVIALSGILLLLGSLMNSNFTFVAALATIAGGIGLLTCSRDLLEGERIKLPIVVGALFFFVAGLLIRIESWLLSILFLLLALAFMLWSSREEVSNRRLIKSSLVMVVSIGLCGIVLLADNACYQDDEFTYWEEYSSLRSRICDYPHKSYNEIGAQLKEIGISQNDYDLVCSAVLIDQSFFSMEKLSEIVSILDENPVPKYSAAVKALSGNRGENIPMTTLAIIVTLTIILLVSVSNRRGLLIASAFILAGLLASLYFIQSGRFPQRVECSVMANAFILAFLAIELCNGESRRKGRLRKAGSLVAACSLVCVCISLFIPSLLNYRETYAELSFANAPREISGDIFEAVNADNEDFYLLSSNAMALEKSLYSYRFIPTKEFMSKNIYSSSWPMGSPQWESVKRERGLSSDLSWIINNEHVYYLDTSESEQYLSFLTYIREHYSADAVAEKHDTWSDEHGRTLVAYAIRLQ